MAAAGAVIKRYREAKGLTQQQLATELGVSVATVTQWETERIHPRRRSAERLDEHLEAGGAVLGALGYTPPGALANEVKSLRAAVEAQRRELDAMHLLLEQMTAAFEQISETGQVRGSWSARVAE